MEGRTDGVRNVVVISVSVASQGEAATDTVVATILPCYLFVRSEHLGSLSQTCLVYSANLEGYDL